MEEKAKQKLYKGSVVVIDDEKDMCQVLTRILNMEGYHVTAFVDPIKAIDYITKYVPDLVLTDIRMPEMDGMQVLAEAKKLDGNIEVIIITAYGSIEGAIGAMKQGAFHYVTKPFQVDELVLTVDRAIQRKRLADENISFTQHLARQLEEMEIIGQSKTIKELKALIAKIAPTDAAVLIRGESGTGKELVARTIHNLSSRHEKRFVAINCAGIPDNLIESELFGYEKGAFTGAEQPKLGLIELASDGTLFLDEIGDLPLHLQAKLLRVLQEREIQRVGGLRQIPVDIRLLAATNQNLEKGIKEKKFRRDLYYRLNVINISLTPLRYRPEDIEPLVQFFIEKYCHRLHRPVISISPEALQVLKKYDWPGNVRELQNVIERIIVLMAGNEITAHDIPPDVRGETVEIERPVKLEPTEVGDYRQARQDFEKEYFQDLLRRAKGSVTEAARLSGLSRRNLYDKIEKLGINLDDFKET